MDSRDARARRRVADQVRNAVISGSIAPVMAAHAGEPERAADLTLESAAAASAVVLASDLRAPAENGQVFERDKYGNSRPVNADESSKLAEDGGLAISGRTHYVSPNRQGWRARLANVERMLAESLSEETGRVVASGNVLMVLAEVRAMLDERP